MIEYHHYFDTLTLPLIFLESAYIRVRQKYTLWVSEEHRPVENTNRLYIGICSAKEGFLYSTITSIENTACFTDNREDTKIVYAFTRGE